MAAERYKKIENRIINQLSIAIKKGLRRLSDSVSALFNSGNRKFTIMFIPHSEKRVINFRITVFSIVFVFILALSIIGVFFVYTTKMAGVDHELTQKTTNLENTEKNMELLLDQLTNLKRVSKKFESSLNKALDTLNIDSGNNVKASVAEGDFSSILKTNESEIGVLSEVNDLKNLSEYMESSVESFGKITELIMSQGDLLVELPTLWPVAHGDGTITNYFGPAEHPFTHQWYLHKGLDIAYGLGKPILAAANGKVIEKGFEPLGYGNYFVIRHNYGFLTRYAHLSNVYVKEGDVVTQGQVLGTMGSTGLSTGPHLHFEVCIGSQVVDPEKFLNVRKN